MKKITILAAFLTVSFFGYSINDTTYLYKKVVVNKDTILVTTKTVTIVDSVPKKQNREYMQTINQSLNNIAESRKLQNAELDRLEAYWKKEKVRVKAELAK